MGTQGRSGTSGGALQISLTEADFEGIQRRKLQALTVKSEVLDGDGTNRDLVEALRSALPTAIARKVDSLVPPNFSVSELQFKLNVSGQVFGTGVAGEVLVKLAPKSEKK